MVLRVQEWERKRILDLYQNQSTSVSSIAKRMERSIYTVRRVLRSNLGPIRPRRVPITPEESQLIRDLRAQNMTYEEIRAVTGRSDAGISRHVNMKSVSGGKG